MGKLAVRARYVVSVIELVCLALVPRYMAKYGCFYGYGHPQCN